MVINTAVIAAAGLGTRLLPVTKAVPKALLPIYHKPMIHYILEELVNSNIKNIVIVVSSYNNNFIRNYFSDDIYWSKFPELDELTKMLSKVNIEYVVQELPLGPGHAVLKAKDIIGNNSFVAIWADDIIDSKLPASYQLIEVYDKYFSSVVGVQAVDKNLVYRYGIIDATEIRPGVYKVHKLIEKPPVSTSPSNLAIVGRHICTANIFSVLEYLNKVNKNTEIPLTEALDLLIDEENVYACEIVGSRYDVGNPDGLLNASISMSKRNL